MKPYTSARLPSAEAGRPAARATAEHRERSPESARAERRGWVILWLAFATFCTLLVSGVRLAVDYVTTAEINLTASVETLDGIVFLQQAGNGERRVASGNQELDVGSTVEATRVGSITLAFFDGSHMTAHTGARVTLDRMDVGRFTTRKTLVLTQLAGPVRYEVSGETVVQVPNGVARLGPGDFTVWVQGLQTQVLAYRGAGRLESNGVAEVVRADQRAILTADGQVQGGLPRATNLVANGDFVHRDQSWEPHDLQNGPRDVDGVRRWTDGPPELGGLPALQIDRASVSSAHGETGVRQPLEVDVSGYRNLYLEAWVRVDFASLSGGGQLGSEYPMMLRLQYEGPTEGSRLEWVHGFYYANPEDRPVTYGEQIPQGAWHEYRVNLMSEDEQRRPLRLLELYAMGQGHSYNARIAAIRLVGD